MSQYKMAVIHGGFTIKDALKKYGFQWDAKRKVWTYTSDWKDEAEVKTVVKRIPGVGNRGNYTITLEPDPDEAEDEALEKEAESLEKEFSEL